MLAFRTLLAAAAAVLALSVPALAEDHPAGIHIHDPYARSMGGVGASGAVFFMIHNHTEADERLVGARADVAQKIELHTHKEGADGVMQMVEIEGGIPLAAGEMHELARGADHVMLMGLTRELKDGDTFPLTLVFESGTEVSVDVTVDNARKPAEGDGHMMNHGEGHGHGMQQEGDASGAMQHDPNGHGHAGHGAPAMVDQAGMADADAVVAVMKAQFDTPENPLLVAPVVVEGVHALASWEQDGKGGRALLRKGHMGWEIVLCGGKDLRMPEFLGQHGVQGADALSALFNTAEDQLGSDKVALYSSFEGLVMIAGH